MRRNSNIHFAGLLHKRFTYWKIEGGHHANIVWHGSKKLLVIIVTPVKSSVEIAFRIVLRHAGWRSSGSRRGPHCSCRNMTWYMGCNQCIFCWYFFHWRHVSFFLKNRKKKTNRPRPQQSRTCSVKDRLGQYGHLPASHGLA